MKTIYEHSVGGDGGMAGIYIIEGKLEIKGDIEIAKVVGPLMNLLAPVKLKIEGMLPDVVKPYVENIFKALEDEVTKLISE